MSDSNKKELDKISELAAGYFNQGYNCTESVFKAIVEVFKPECQSQLPLLTGLGGGVGGQGYCCGAITGAVVAAGINFGRNAPDPEAKKQAYQKAAKILNSFKQKFSSTDCADLKPKDSQLQRKICGDYVGYAAQVVAEIIGCCCLRRVDRR